MYKYILIIPVVFLLLQDIKVFQIEGNEFLIKIGLLSVGWIFVSISSFILEIPILISFIFLIRALIFSFIYIYSVLRSRKLF